LHTYFAVPDVTQATLHGLAGQTEWDSLTNTFATAPETLRFAAEFDRVYSAPDKAANPAKTTRLTLNQSLRISQSASWANTVVWNPAQDLCRRLVDMPDDGWRHMLCVEAAQVFEPIQVPPNGHWAGWQQLQVLDR
jgi:glucose-6-phosphate 1-epimerase